MAEPLFLFGLSAAQTRGALHDARRLAFFGDGLLSWLLTLHMWRARRHTDPGQITARKLVYQANDTLSRFVETAARPLWLASIQHMLTAVGSDLRWETMSVHNRGTVVEALLWTVYTTRGEAAAQTIVDELIAWVDADDETFGPVQAAGSLGGSGSGSGSGPPAATSVFDVRHTSALGA